MASEQREQNQTTYHDDLREHSSAMQARARTAGRGVRKIALAARSDLVGPDWQALLAEAFGPDDEAANDTASLVARAQRIRTSPAVSETAEAIMRRLYLASRAHVDQVQRKLYRMDQEERARIYNRHTGSQWKIEAVVEEKELAVLAGLPVLGNSRDELLGSYAQQWRDRFSSSVGQALGGKPGTFMTGVQVLARKVNRTFDWWIAQVSKVAELCAAEALAASAREALKAFRPPRDEAEAAERKAVDQKVMAGAAG